MVMMRRLLRDSTPPVIWRALRKLRQGASSASRPLEVPINQCVHYCGFRHGVNEYNPYESYLSDLKDQVPLLVARRRFIDFLLYYRPHHLAEALGLANLSQKYPLWKFPWERFDRKHWRKAWFPNPIDRGILTRFCGQGILSLGIEAEFVRLESALLSISTNDYQPEVYKSYARVRQLRRLDGKCAYILLDGNHRVSAMSVLGYRTVEVTRSAADVWEQDCDRWPGVKRGLYSREDALKIFHAYFDGNHNYRTTTKPAKIIAPDSWLEIYALEHEISSGDFRTR